MPKGKKETLPPLAAYQRAIAAWLPAAYSDTAALFKALAHAYGSHRHQRRHSGEPYIDHPVAVLRILAQEFGIRVPDILIAALLHDIVEDVEDESVHIVESAFGRNVALLVDGCTKLRSANIDKASLKSLTHDKIFLCSGRNIGVLTIKLADRLHNLRTLHHLRPTKRQRIAQETIDVYAPLATALNLYPLKRELYQLALTHLFSKKSKKIVRHIDTAAKSPEASALQEALRHKLCGAFPSVSIRFRPKGLSNYFDIDKKTLELSNTKDRADFTVVLDTNNALDCYHALGMVNTAFPVVPKTIRDFITNPKTNGYRSLHVRIKGGEANYVVKIRTTEMDVWANFGVFTHWREEHPFSEEHWEEVFSLLTSLGQYQGGVSRKRDLLGTPEREEIFVYSPKGDIFYLPKKSSVLDFAFKVHTELGEYCGQAVVDGLPASPVQELRDGQTVRIHRAKEKIQPSPELEHACHTPKARTRLFCMMADQRRAHAAAIGKALMAHALRRAGLPQDTLKGETLDLVLAVLNLPSPDALFTRLGQDSLQPDVVLYYLDRPAPASGPGGPAGAAGQEPFILEIGDILPGIHKFARCCLPFPGQDGVVAGLSERGVSLHHGTCPETLGRGRHQSHYHPVRWLTDRIWPRPIRFHVRLTGFSDAARLFAVLPGIAPAADVHSITFQQGTAEPSCRMAFTCRSLAACKTLHDLFPGMTLRVEAFSDPTPLPTPLENGTG
ncbi:MAG: HD domain-containing protein [Desulfovibrionaceae bacterium]